MTGMWNSGLAWDFESDYLYLRERNSEKLIKVMIQKLLQDMKIKQKEGKVYIQKKFEKSDI